LQNTPSLQFTGEPVVQTPPAQTSPTVHALPSLHVALLLVFTQPEAALQESLVHGLLSLQFRDGPLTQTPLEHASPIVQALPSSQPVEMAA